jgi:hypothetical protein
MNFLFFSFLCFNNECCEKISFWAVTTKKNFTISLFFGNEHCAKVMGHDKECERNSLVLSKENQVVRFHFHKKNFVQRGCGVCGVILFYSLSFHICVNLFFKGLHVFIFKKQHCGDVKVC